MKPETIIVNDLMQKEYVYQLSEPPGKNFHPDFAPPLTPQQMLALGVFGGKHMTDIHPLARHSASGWEALTPGGEGDLVAFMHQL